MQREPDAEPRPPEAPTYSATDAQAPGRRSGDSDTASAKSGLTTKLLLTRLAIVCAFVAGLIALTVYRMETGLSLKLTFGALAAATVVARWLYVQASPRGR